MLRLSKKIAAFAGPRRAKGRRIFRGWVQVRIEFCDLHPRVVRSLPHCRPRAGEGWGGGSNKRDIASRPLPPTPPRKGPARGRGEERDPLANRSRQAAALCRASSAWYSLNSSATALAMLGRARSRS